ncbi:MAG: restriction endonuclease subunit S, partial [Clostridia bacterium]|nr:restriction endonuclease subunit S [Clostridia bacterium]
MLIKNVLTSVSESFNYKDKTKVIFLNTGDILEGKFLHSNLSNVKTLPGQAKKSIKHNDILYSEIRPINKHFALVNFEETNNYVVSTKLMVLRNISESYNTKFIYQYLTSDKVIYDLQTMAESRSGTFPQITYEQLSTINLPDISLDEQQHIVNILGSIDNKIENLELITKKLQLEIKFNFIKEYNNLMSEKVIALEE